MTLMPGQSATFETMIVFDDWADTTIAIEEY